MAMHTNTGTAPRWRAGRATLRDDGTAVCRRRIPLGHPAATFFERDGTPFEIEHDREFVAGPGVTTPRAIDPTTGEETIVGANLLPVGDGNPLIHVGTSNLESFLRQAAKRFDVEAVAVAETATRTTRRSTRRYRPERDPCEPFSTLTPRSGERRR